MMAPAFSHHDTKALIGRVADLLSTQEKRAYLVGGYVRDLVLGRNTSDVDIALSEGDSIAMARMVADALSGAFYVLDAERGYARVLTPSDSDGATVTFDFTPLRGTLEEDLAHRDFTIDALALPMESADSTDAVIDLYGGRQDLGNRLVRALGDDVFQEDPARLLRAVRLAGQLEFQIEGHTGALIAQQAEALKRVSLERVQDEFCRILSLERSYPWLRELDRLHLLTQVLPQLEESRGVDQPHEHYWDVFDHLVETVGVFERIVDGAEREGDSVLSLMPWMSEVDDYFDTEVAHGRSRAVLTKLACLLHDVAKPRTKTTEPSGKTRFLGHPEQGANMAREIMETLHFSRREIVFITTAVSQHLRPMQLSHDLEPPTPRALYRFQRDVADVAIATLYLSMADYLAAKGPMLEPDEWQRRVEHCKRVLQSIGETTEERVETPHPLVDGYVLMKGLGISSGPLLGRLLDTVQEAVAVGEVKDVEGALALARALMYESLKDDMMEQTGREDGQ